MANMPFDLFKLRASYGLTGNAEIGNFLHRGQWGASRYDGMPGTRPIQTENPDLRWERTGQFNAGLDLSLLGDRVSAQVDYYLKQTTDLLLNVNVPGTTGFTLETRNVGSLRNEGVEFVINTRNLTGNFGWTSNFVFGTNRNRITDLDGQVIEGGFINRAIEGHPIGVFFGLEYAGVDPDNGDALYYINERDENGNIINAGATTWNPNLANRVVLGSPHPDFTGGFGNNFTYGNFSLSALLQFSYGNQIYDGGGRFKSANGDFLDNQSADQMRRWRQPGDITDVPQARLFDENGTTHSSRYLYDGSYLRLKNVAVSYQIPRGLLQQAQLQSARIFVAGQNLLTWTRYPWWDPEVNTDFLAGNIGLGNEFYSAPQARTITTGIQVNF
jgi:TonB-dependent starch-binding outer membrane protein SusC